LTTTNPIPPTASPIRIREVKPDDKWVGDPLSYGSQPLPRIVPKIVAEQRALPREERAAVFYFDIPLFSPAGNVQPILDWVASYQQDLKSNEIAPAMIAIGHGVDKKEQQQLAKAAIHYIDDSRRRIQKLMGSGTRDHQIYRLIQNLSGYPIGPMQFPYPVGSNPPPGTPSPASPVPQTAKDWEIYGHAPAHIDRREVDELFKQLTNLKDWERDS
jgi:hypothetical protein